ncbi:MAG: MFS transporter [Nitrososphaerota archaeon]|nr:MFS transporter [Nitrososphaerota archaeon]
MEQDYRSVLDRASWTGIHWTVFSSTALGFFAWGFVYSLSVLVTSWSIVPIGGIPILLTISPIFLVTGNFLLGSLADRVGRRPAFMVTVAVYATGIAGVILSPNFYTLLLFVAIAQLGVGGEEPTALAALAEFTPVRHRGKAIVLSSNFYNIGAFVAASLILYGLSSVPLQKTVLGIAALLLIGTILFTRRRLPESVRWLVKRGRVKEAEQLLGSVRGQVKEVAGFQNVAVATRPKYSARFAFTILALLGVSQLTTYGLLAFIIGPYSFSSIAPQIVMVANAGASVAGFLGAYVVDRLSRRFFSLFSYLGGLVTVTFVLAAVGVVSSNILVFFVFLFLNMIFSELGWAARVVLEPELAMGTNLRSTFIALVRVVAWGFFITSIYLTSSLSTFGFVELNVLLWGLGAMAAFAWFMRGVETRRESLESITGESYA